MCSLRPYTFSVVPPVQSTTSLLQWWRQPPQLGSGLLLPLPSQAIAFTTCLPHGAALLSVCFSSWSHFKLLQKKTTFSISLTPLSPCCSKRWCWAMPHTAKAPWLPSKNAATSSFKLILSFFFSNCWESYLTFYLKSGVMFLPKTQWLAIYLYYHVQSQTQSNPRSWQMYLFN